MKISILLFIVLITYSLSAIDFFSEDLDCFTEMVVIIGSDEFIPANHKINTRNGLLRILIKSKNTIAYSGDYPIDYQSIETANLKNEVISYFIDVNLPKGNYTALIEMFDSKGILYHLDEYAFKVKRKKKVIAEPYIYTIISGNSYLWSDGLINSMNDSEILLRQACFFEPDSVLVNYEKQEFSYSNNLIIMNIETAKSKSSFPLIVEIFNNEKVDKFKVLSQTAYFLFRKKYTTNEQYRQLKYILKDKEIKEMYSDNEAVLINNIEKYWENSNPEPYSYINVYQQSFYNRILEADKKYSIVGYLDGWETDMGEIFIRFGQPDEIVKEVFPDKTKPYEIWTYYKLEKKFLFIDKEGDGVYVLKKTYN